jgi:Tfp pilus assembly PilM family ATPase
MEGLLVPLGRELRASMDFFEHQHDCLVSRVFLTGGSSRSDFIVQRLKQELMVDCEVLNPLTFLQVPLPPEKTSEVEQVATQLSVAVGAALGAL